MSKSKVHIVGLGMGPEDLTKRHLEIIYGADVLVGGRRHLGYFPDHTGEKIVLGSGLKEVLYQVKRYHMDRQVVILASGDPLFFGVAKQALEIIGSDEVEIHPNVTVVQRAFSLIKRPWHDTVTVSLHGRNGWDNLDRALLIHDQVVVLTDRHNGPIAIARHLLDKGLREASVCVLEDIGQDTEKISWFLPHEEMKREFSPLNIVIIFCEKAPESEHGKGPRLKDLFIGMPDDTYIHSKGLITKSEIRTLSISKLFLSPGQILWDIGAGCGSVGIEATVFLRNGRVFAVEKEPHRAAHIRANCRRLDVKNLEVICDQAPECLLALPDPDRVFIGGGGSELPKIIRTASERLGPGGRIVTNVILLNSLYGALEAMEEEGLVVDILHVQISRGKSLCSDRYMSPLNPVWILTGIKR